MRPANPRPDARPSHSPSATAGHWWPAAVGTLSFPEWRLLDAAGQLVPSCAGFSFAERDCGPLTTAGSPYAIEVRDNGLNSTETYGLHLQRLTAPARCSGDTLANDVPSTGTIEAPVDTNLFSFAASDGERVHVTAAVGTLSFPEWRLLDAAGQPAAGCAAFTFTERDCGPLVAGSSPYAIEVRDNGLNSAGTYTLHLQRLTAGARSSAEPLICDAPAIATIEAPTDTDIFSFSASDGERVHVTAAVGTLSFPEWRLLDA